MLHPVSSRSLSCIVLAFAFSLCAPGGAHAQELEEQLRDMAQEGVWTVTVAKAEGLPDRDPLRGRGTSDPFVEVYVAQSNDQHLRRLGETQVVQNSADPEWNRAFTIKGGDELHLAFAVWDRDKLGNRILGICHTWSVSAGRSYTLNLHAGLTSGLAARILKVATPRDSMHFPGKRAAPGTLTVTIKRRLPAKPVPDVRGQKADAARATLEDHLFRTNVSRRLVRDRDRIGQVLAMSPAPDAKTELGSTIRLVVGYQPMRRVPNLTGKPLRRARRMLFPAFRRVTVTYQPPPVGAPRRQWMTVAKQTPEADAKVPMLTPV